MHRTAKENLPPCLESARKSKVPVSKTADVKRKRQNTSSPSNRFRPPVTKSPRSCRGKKTVGVTPGNLSQDLWASKTPLRSTCRKGQFLVTEYDQQDTEFETDEAALQSILNNTGIQTTPTIGHKTRHTLATVNNQRTSIYAPPEKKDIHSFRKMCEDYARGRSQNDGKQLFSSSQSIVSQSPGILTEARAFRRMTTDSQFTPKRRCTENKWSQGGLGKNKENSLPGKATEIYQKHNKDIRVHFKGDSLGVVTEEKTEDLTQNNCESSESVSKDKTVHKKKLLQSFTADLTPQRVPRSDRLTMCSSTDNDIRYNNNRESMPGRILKEVDALNDITKTPIRNQIGLDNGGPGAPIEKRIGELKCLTPSRVLVQKKLNTDSPKVYSFSATPMRVLKHMRSKPDIQNKGYAQDFAKVSISKEEFKKETSEMITDIKSVSTEMGLSTSGETNLKRTERCIKKQMIMSSGFTATAEHMCISEGYPDVENIVWTPKATAAKTPVKQEILTSKVEKSYNQRQLVRDKTQAFDSDVTRNHQTNKLECTTYTNTNSSRHEGTRPMMQLPVIIAEQPVLEPDEMPNSADTDWCMPKTGPLVSQSLKLDETPCDKGQDSFETTPSKSFDISSARQELLDQVHQHLGRKLQRFENTRSGATVQFPLQREHISADHLNRQNNNLHSSEVSLSTGELIQTAGQFINHTSQGIDNHTNANSHVPLDINCNVGTLAMNSSHPFNKAQSNTTHHPLTNTNVTLTMSEHKGSDIDKQPSVDTDRATLLRKPNMNTKVVSLDFVVNTEDTMSQSDNKSPLTDTLLSSRSKDLESKKDTAAQERIYAPTPCVMRKPESLEYSVEENDLKSTIPLMTPLALKMMAKRKKEVKNMFDDTASSSKSMQKPTFYHQTEEKENLTVSENLEQYPAETLLKTPPSSKTSAFSVVKKSSLTPLVGSMSLRGNSLTKTRSHVGSTDKWHKGILLSMNERYQEALLDDEVTRFAERLVAERVGFFPRCTDPVAKILLEGDDMHFVPITEDNLKPYCSGYIPGCAFTKYKTLVGLLSIKMLQSIQSAVMRPFRRTNSQDNQHNQSNPPHRDDRTEDGFLLVGQTASERTTVYTDGFRSDRVSPPPGYNEVNQVGGLPSYGDYNANRSIYSPTINVSNSSQEYSQHFPSTRTHSIHTHTFNNRDFQPTVTSFIPSQASSSPEHSNVQESTTSPLIDVPFVMADRFRNKKTVQDLRASNLLLEKQFNWYEYEYDFRLEMAVLDELENRMDVN